jgi:uncharacterized membrane protein YesL
LVEKPLYQKLNSVADWIIRLIMVNILVVLTALPIITFYAAFSTGYNVFSDYLKKDEAGILKSFWAHLKTGLRKKLILGTLFIFLGAFFYYNMSYYENLLNQDLTIFYQIGYFVSLSLLIITVLLCLQSFPVSYVHIDLKIKKILKLSFMVAGKFFLLSILLISFYFIPIGLFLGSLTVVLNVFVGFSIPILMNALITKKVVGYLEGLVIAYD